MTTGEEEQEEDEKDGQGPDTEQVVRTLRPRQTWTKRSKESERRQRKDEKRREDAGGRVQGWVPTRCS